MSHGSMTATPSVINAGNTPSYEAYPSTNENIRHMSCMHQNHPSAVEIIWVDQRTLQVRLLLLFLLLLLPIPETRPVSSRCSSPTAIVTAVSKISSTPIISLLLHSI